MRKSIVRYCGLAATALLSVYMLCVSVSADDFEYDGSSWQQNFMTYGYIKMMADSESGYYALMGQYLYYIDHETLDAVKLCSRLECNHKNRECNAYIGYLSYPMAYGGGNLYFFISEGLYEEIVAVSQDGETREVLFKTVDEKLNLNILEYCQGNVYFLIDLDDDGWGTSVWRYSVDDHERYPVHEVPDGICTDLFLAEDYLYYDEGVVDDSGEFVRRLERNTGTDEDSEVIELVDSQTGDSVDFYGILREVDGYLYIFAVGESEDDRILYRWDQVSDEAEKVFGYHAGYFPVMDMQYLYVSSLEEKKIYAYSLEGGLEYAIDVSSQCRMDGGQFIVMGWTQDDVFCYTEDFDECTASLFKFNRDDVETGECELELVWQEDDILTLPPVDTN